MRFVTEIDNGLFKNADSFKFDMDKPIWFDIGQKTDTVGVFQRLREVEPVRYGETITISELRGALNAVFGTTGVIPAEEPGRYVWGFDPIARTTESVNTTQEIQPLQAYATEEDIINYFDRISQDEEQQTNTEH